MKRLVSFFVVAAFVLGSFAPTVFAGIGGDGAHGYAYFTDSSSIGQTVQCTPVEEEGDFVRCLMAGAESLDTALFVLVTEGDATGHYIYVSGDSWGESGFIQLN